MYVAAYQRVLQIEIWLRPSQASAGQTFELDSASTWLPVFIAANVAVYELGAGAAGEQTASAAACAASGGGGRGCVRGGSAADPRGRERQARGSTAVRIRP